jgi:DNA-binding MarR family transcriptional regulator
MPEECCDDIVSLLSTRMPILRDEKEQNGLSFLSAEARILAVIIRNNNTIMKDIPLITGISFRSCYEIISKLSALGIIAKKTHPSDRRAVVLSVDKLKLCEIFCGHQSY